MEEISQDKLVSTIRSATEEVFGTMLGLPAEAKPHYVERSSSQPYDGVIGLVGLAGAWAGAGRISCSADLACLLSGTLLASEYTAVNADVLDAMAEMTNMIIGSVKSTLEEMLGPMGLSIPTVIFGRNYQARSSGVKEWVVVPFDCSGQLFEVRLALVPDGRSLDGTRHFNMHEVM
jgi:chemotaxis protein CheX